MHVYTLFMEAAFMIRVSIRFLNLHQRWATNPSILT